MRRGASEKRRMKKKITVLTLSAMLFALCGSVEAQQPKKVPRIGFLITGSRTTEADRIEAFSQGLRELGYIDEKNIKIEYRFAEGVPERQPGLAEELVRLNVDVIVAPNTLAVEAAKQATTKIPIVFPGVADPVAFGFVASFAGHGGNLTWVEDLCTVLRG